MHKKFIYGSGALALILGLSVIVLLNYQGDSPAHGNTSDAVSKAPRMSFTSNISRASTAGISKHKLIADYKAWSVYPPDSRPLKAGHTDVLEYQRIAAPMQRMPVQGEKKGELKDSGYSCRLQPLRHSLTEGLYMHITLACFRTGKADPQQILIRDYRLEARAGSRRFRPVQPTVNDSGRNGDAKAGDGIQTFEFRPRKSDWAEMYLTVNFQIQGDASNAKHSLRTHFFSSPTAPARFTGKFKETVRDGSLVISAELIVKRPGNYTIEGNLFAGDEPLGFARKDAKLAVGRNFVELLYYGKIIRDGGLDGPYRLTGLRGTLNTDVIQPELLARPPAEVAKFLKTIRDDRPKRMVIPYFKGDFLTAEYTARSFTDREYDSPRKRRRIAQLQALPES